eukprot:6123705-Amphidinium_carterae.1
MAGLPNRVPLLPMPNVLQFAYQRTRPQHASWSFRNGPPLTQLFPPYQAHRLLDCTCDIVYVTSVGCQ